MIANGIKNSDLLNSSIFLFRRVLRWGIGLVRKILINYLRERKRDNWYPKNLNSFDYNSNVVSQIKQTPFSLIFYFIYFYQPLPKRFYHSQMCRSKCFFPLLSKRWHYFRVIKIQTLWNSIYTAGNRWLVHIQ